LITLYELRWSHYCEKIRLALAHMRLPWRAVAIDAFSKREFAAHPLPAHLPSRTVPALLDERTGRFVMDSTPILQYLDASYPDAPRLFPRDGQTREAVTQTLLELDSGLGLLARRAGYTQLILESPQTLADLFLDRRLGGLWRKPLLRSLAGHALGVMLCQRFSFHRNEAERIYERLECMLAGFQSRIETRGHLAGDGFSIADLSLAAYLRPLSIVPFFTEHPRLAGLFAWQRRLLAVYGAEAPSAYQLAIEAVRKDRAPVRRRVRPALDATDTASVRVHADNDQHPVWDVRMLAMPWLYLARLRADKRRVWTADAVWR